MNKSTNSTAELMDGNYTVRVTNPATNSTELARVRVKDLKDTDRKGEIRDEERYKRKLMHLPKEARLMIRKANEAGKLVIWQTQKGVIQFVPSEQELYNARIAQKQQKREQKPSLSRTLKKIFGAKPVATNEPIVNNQHQRTD